MLEVPSWLGTMVCEISACIKMTKMHFTHSPQTAISIVARCTDLTTGANDIAAAKTICDTNHAVARVGLCFLNVSIVGANAFKVDGGLAVNAVLA